MKNLDAFAIANAYLNEHKHYLSDVNVFKFLSGAIRARDLKRLTSNVYTEPQHSIGGDYQVATQISAFFSKNAEYSGPHCVLAAVDNFHKAERLCKIANKRLKHYDHHPERDAFVTEKAHMRNTIREVLGSFGSFLDQLPKLVRLTSGATEDSTRADSLPFMKIRKRLSCSHGAKPFIETLLRWNGFNPEEVKIRTTDFNRVVLVPKNWKTHRSIACEPVASLPLQLAFDSFVKERFRRKTPIDLSVQSKNQDRARIGSIDGSWATIDLSMASDTLSIECVRILLPRKWYNYLSAVRSRAYRGEDVGTGVYQKFASMGNGSTFPLETLIFYAACLAVGSENPLVYGDDIIIENQLADRVVRLLRHLGFYTNSDKTFSTGDFRESCGADFKAGINVRPLYIRKMPTNRREFAHLANLLFSIGVPSGPVWEIAKTLVVTHKLPLVPHTESTTSGINIPWSCAYARKLIRGKNWILMSKMLVAESDYERIHSHRQAQACLFRVLGFSDPSVSIKGRASSQRTITSWSRVHPCTATPVYQYLLDTYLGNIGVVSTPPKPGRHRR